VNILTHRNINLHSPSTEGGLVHLNANQKKRVPDDVADHPGFKVLVKSGVVVILKSSKPLPLAEVLMKKSVVQEEFQQVPDVPGEGTIILKAGKPIGVSDGKRIIPIDEQSETVETEPDEEEDEPTIEEVETIPEEEK
jgi:hypothetical protein